MSPTLKAVLSLALFGAGPAQAADYSDPTWPCIQRKVETLSLGLMWQYVVPETEADPALAEDVAELGDRLALRRLDLEALRPDVAAFAEAHGGSPEALSRVMARVFGALDQRRTRIIGGIGDFSLGQIELSDKIDATRLEMNAAMAAAEPDFDAVDALEETLDWDQVIFTDRQRSITYLCETPQLIEKRIFAVAQLLAEYVRD